MTIDTPIRTKENTVDTPSVAAAHRRRFGRAVAAAGVLLGLVLVAAAAPAVAATPLIDASPSTIAIDAPAPGEQQTWQMSVHNVSDGEVTLQMRLEGESERLFSGAHPLHLEVREVSTGAVIASGPAGALLGQTISLPRLAAGATYLLEGIAELPFAADNFYQYAGAILRVGFDAQEVPVEAVGAQTPPAVEAVPVAGPVTATLPATGGTLPVAAMLAAGLAVLCGLILVARRRRRDEPDDQQPGEHQPDEHEGGEHEGREHEGGEHQPDEHQRDEHRRDDRQDEESGR